MVENITERIQAEVQRQALAERLDIATRIAGIGVFEWDLVAGTRESNAKSLEILGISREHFEHERGDPANLGLANTQYRARSAVRHLLRADQPGLDGLRIRPDGRYATCSTQACTALPAKLRGRRARRDRPAALRTKRARPLATRPARPRRSSCRA
jgi:PAS domain-containing protein